MLYTEFERNIEQLIELGEFDKAEALLSKAVTASPERPAQPFMPSLA